MGTRIEPTISGQASEKLTSDDSVHDPRETDDLLAELMPGHAGPRPDPTLEELAALENEVDNWLHPPTKVETAPAEPAPPLVDMPDHPAVPDLRQAAAPHKRRPARWWMLAVAAVAALAAAAVLVNKPAPPEQAFEPVAASAPVPASVPAPVPAAAAIAAAPASKPPEMVFLDTPPAAASKASGAPAKPAGAEPVAAASQAGTPDDAAAVIKKPVKAKKNVTPKKSSVAKKKDPSPEQARRTRTWPSEQRASDARRLDAAVAECRARSRDPGACNIRVCDVLGRSHPACRD